MSRPYSFYYSTKHGVGIVSFNNYSVENQETVFEDGTVSREKISDLFFLSRGGNYYGQSDEELFYYGEGRFYDAWKKGAKLFESGQVTPEHKGSVACFTVADNNKKFTVRVLTKRNQEKEIRCDCGEMKCCHHAAVCRYFTEHIRRMKQVYLSMKDQDHSLFLGSEMKNKLSEYGDLERKDPEERKSELVREIIGLLLKVGTASYTGGLLNSLFSERVSWVYRSDAMTPYIPLFTAMYLDPEISCLLSESDRYLDHARDRQYKSNCQMFEMVKKELAVFEKEQNKGEYTESLVTESALTFLEKWEELLKYYAFTKSKLKETDEKRLQKIALKFVAEDCDFEAGFNKKEKTEETNRAVFPESATEAVKQIVRRLDQSAFHNYNPAAEMLVSLLKTEDAEELISGLNNYVPGFDRFQKLGHEAQKKLMLNMLPDKEIVDYVIENVLTDASDFEKAEYFFSTLEKCCGSFEVMAVREPLARLLGSLPENGLMKLEAQYRYRGFTEDSVYESLHSLRDSRTFSVGIKSAALYYAGNWAVEESDGQIVVCHLLTPPGRVQKGEIEIFEYPDGKYIGGHLARKFSKDSLQMLAGLNRELFGEKIDAEVKRLREAVQAREFAVKNGKLVRAYDALVSELKREKVIFTDSLRVNLRYLLNEEDGKLHLSFRVGNVKDYVVQNAYEFLDAFRSRKTVKYGKDLVFTHDSENLQPEDQPVLRMLTAMRFTQPKGDAKQKRYIPVKGAMLADILDTLKGRKIQFQGENCLVRLEETGLKAVIGKEGDLSLIPSMEGKKFYVSDGKGFLFTPEKNGWVVDRIRGNAEEISFLKFASEYGGVSLRPIFPDFKKNLYSRFFDIIEVDPSLTQEFKLDGIRINAYFDYDEKIITCREEFLQAEKEISREEIRERIDLGKLDQFDAFLSQLGFENGKITDEGHILNFFKTDFSKLKKIAAVYLSESLSRKSIVTMNRQNVRVTCKGNLMEAVLEKSEFTEAELEKILQALRKKKKYLLLDRDRLVDLDSEQAKGFAETVKDLGLEPGKLYKKKQLAMVNALKAFAHEKNCSIDRHLRQMIEEVRTYREAQVKVPALKLPMRSYQEEGFKWMYILSGYGLGGILADDMGLGKTVQVIALLASDKTEKPDLVVCPKSLVFNWINEFARFAPEMETEEIYGPASQRAEQISKINYEKQKVYITSYDSLRNDIAGYTGEFRYCILDEAQFIKNATALKSQSVKELKAVHRFALTGTPIENTVEDLWSIFDFLMPGYFEDLPEFRAASRQEEFAGRIAAQIGPFVLRRVKENVLSDLPQKYERILSTEMTESQRELYDALRLKASRLLEETGKAFDLLPYLMHLRQICVDPELYADRYDGGSGKMELLEEMIPEYLAAGHRILLFSQFVKGLNRVEQMLKRKEIPYFMITGDTDAKKRTEMIREFNSTEGTDVFLISLKAGGTGLNLTGADTVIHLDPWWNTAAENQATDRAHRIGQTRNVEVIKLIANRSIEQRVIELQNQKQSLIDQIISDDESSVVNASLEDIRFVLQ